MGSIDWLKALVIGPMDYYFIASAKYLKNIRFPGQEQRFSFLINDYLPVFAGIETVNNFHRRFQIIISFKHNSPGIAGHLGDDIFKSQPGNF